MLDLQIIVFGLEVSRADGKNFDKPYAIQAVYHIAGSILLNIPLKSAVNFHRTFVCPN